MVFGLTFSQCDVWCPLTAAHLLKKSLNIHFISHAGSNRSKKRTNGFKKWFSSTHLAKTCAPSKATSVNSTTHFRTLQEKVWSYFVMQTEANQPLFIWRHWTGLLQQLSPAASTIHHRRFWNTQKMKLLVTTTTMTCDNIPPTVINCPHPFLYRYMWL